MKLSAESLALAVRQAHLPKLVMHERSNCFHNQFPPFLYKKLDSFQIARKRALKYTHVLLYRHLYSFKRFTSRNLYVYSCLSVHTVSICGSAFLRKILVGRIATLRAFPTLKACRRYAPEPCKGRNAIYGKS